MRYQVQGVETRSVTIEVEADSEEEAFELAEQADSRDIDVWDSEINWFHILPQ